MVNLSPSFRKDSYFFRQLKWTVLARIVFSGILAFSCLLLTTRQGFNPLYQPFAALYYLAATFLALSIGYAVWLKWGNHLLFLAYVQIILDTFAVTAIIFLTGSFNSVFTFLYLVVIIYSAMLLLRKGSLLIATIASIQYGLLIELEYYNFIPVLWNPSPISEDPGQVIYRTIITIAAFFAVAVLSGILSLQLKIARQDLKITQEHLKRVEKMEAMDEMISGIAHEIKNPLASLSGSIQLLREDALPGSYEDKLMQIILRETERLKNIVNDLRLFAKPNRADAVPVNISDAINDVVALFLNTPQWKERIEIRPPTAKDLYIDINPIHLQQILWNLMKNAAESIPDRGRIAITLESPGNQRIYLSIQDNGGGIDQKTARQIFDPFFTTKPEGTGLGLSIIHRLIHTYEGMIDFDSIPGKGSVFTIIFKNAKSPDPSTKS